MIIPRKFVSLCKLLNVESEVIITYFPSDILRGDSSSRPGNDWTESHKKPTKRRVQEKPGRIVSAQIAVNFFGNDYIFDTIGNKLFLKNNP